jgi:beta-glucosidase
LIIHIVGEMDRVTLKTFACVLPALLSLVSAAGPLQKKDKLPDGFYVPAYYPAPYGGWVNDWADSYEKARELVDSMTLAEKTNITGGTGIFMGKSDLASTRLKHVKLLLTVRQGEWLLSPFLNEPD